jgi:signal transduction histidine kinase
MATTRDDIFAIDRAYEVGATSFVTKPVNWRLIGHQMRYVLRMHKVEMELRRARDEAEAAARLKNNIVGLMSHETRTPLGVILGFAGMIRSQAHGPVGHADYLAYAERIVESGERLHDTLGSLQLFAEVSATSVEPTMEMLPLDEIAHAALRDANLSEAARRRIELSPTLAQVELRCDPRLMAAALKQLVRNAIRHAGDSCHVRVSIDRRPDGEVGVVVADDGKGMDAATVENALKPFLEQSRGGLHHGDGLGIGIPLARRVAELHGGRLELRSAPGIGTGVTMIMPRKAGAAGQLRGAA